MKKNRVISFALKLFIIISVILGLNFKLSASVLNLAYFSGSVVVMLILVLFENYFKKRVLGNNAYGPKYISKKDNSANFWAYQTMYFVFLLLGIAVFLISVRGILENA